MEQVAVCEGVIDWLKVEVPIPVFVVSATRGVLAVLRSDLAEFEAPAADEDS